MSAISHKRTLGQELEARSSPSINWAEVPDGSAITASGQRVGGAFRSANRTAPPRHRALASAVSAPAVREAGSAETHRGREAICGKREKNGKANVRWSAGRRHCRAVFWRWRKGGERSRNFWSAGNAVAAMIPCRGRVRRGGAGKRGSGCLTAGVGELLGDLLRRAFDDRLDR